MYRLAEKYISHSSITYNSRHSTVSRHNVTSYNTCIFISTKATTSHLTSNVSNPTAAFPFDTQAYQQIKKRNIAPLNKSNAHILQ